MPATSLHAAILELCRTELTSRRSMLLEHLLLGGIRVADLDDMLFATFTVDTGVVELLDDILANVARFKSGIVISFLRALDDRRDLTWQIRLHVPCHSRHGGSWQSTP